VPAASVHFNIQSGLILTLHLLLALSVSPPLSYEALLFPPTIHLQVSCACDFAKRAPTPGMHAHWLPPVWHTQTIDYTHSTDSCWAGPFYRTTLRRLTEYSRNRQIAPRWMITAKACQGSAEGEPLFKHLSSDHAHLCESDPDTIGLFALPATHASICAAEPVGHTAWLLSVPLKVCGGGQGSGPLMIALNKRRQNVLSHVR